LLEDIGSAATRNQGASVAQENRKPKDITELPGVGPTTAEKLVESGFSTIEAIAVATPQEIARQAYRCRRPRR